MNNLIEWALSKLSFKLKVLIPGVILSLFLIGLGVLYSTTTRLVNEQVREITENLALDAQVVSDLTKNNLQQRLNTKAYVKNGEAEAKSAFFHESEEVKKVLDKASKSIADPQRKQLLAKIAQLEEQYVAEFDEVVVTQMEKRHQLVREHLDKIGPQIEKKLSLINDSAYQDQDGEAAYYAARVQRNYLLGRLSVFKFLTNNDESSANTATTQLETAMQEMKRLSGALQNPKRRQLAKTVNELLLDYSQSFRGVFEAIQARNAGIAKMDMLGPQITDAAQALMKSVFDAMHEQAVSIEEEFDQARSTTLWASALAVLSGLGVALWLATKISHRLGAEPEKLEQVAEAIANDQLDIELDDIERSRGVYASMIRMRDNLRERLAKERKEARENGRIRRSLDGVSGKVMICDEAGRVIYLNQSLTRLLEQHQSEFKKSIENFSASNISQMTAFNFIEIAGMSKQEMLALRNAKTIKVKTGRLTFEVIINPVINRHNEITGFAFEWTDQTQELAIQKEIANIVEKAQAGNLAESISLNDKQGFFRLVSEGINRLLAVNRQIIEESSRSIQAIAEGNLSVVMTSEYLGAFGQLKENVNRTIALLDNSIRDIDELVRLAQDGILDNRIDLAGKSGFFYELGEKLNQLMNTSQNIILDASRVMEAAAAGDLSRRIEREYAGEFKKLAGSINQTNNKLEEVVVEINLAAENVNVGAREIALGNDNLSQRTEEQAASLEQTAASMQAMTETLRLNAKQLLRANELAELASTNADTGQSVVADTVQAMDEISRSSGQISEIISVIDDIAFQTNLLALNAAVEAARAGEKGKGFAVVANEVRALAQKSTESAAKISKLIEQSLSQVQRGDRLVKRSGEALADIMSAVAEVREVVAQINQAGQEQLEGIEQVNKAINEMESITQQNAALVEQAAAASESMGEQAEMLQSLMGFFKVKAAV